MKVLVFAPHSLLWKHAFPEALVAESLSQHGHQVVYVTCGSFFGDYCISMFSSQVAWNSPEREKRSICEACGRNASVLREQFKFPGFELVDRWTGDDEVRLEAFMAGVARDNFRDVDLNGVRVGRLALYQVLLRHKKISYDFTDDQWAEYLAHLGMTAKAAIVTPRVIDEVSPDRVILYNSLYSVNSVCREIAGRQGIATYFLHAGGGLSNRLQTLMMGRGHTFDFYPALLDEWPRFRSAPVDAEAIRPATNHFIQLLMAKSPYAYSPMRSQGSVDIRNLFGIGLSQKILVATMGSYDEEVAAEEVGARVHRTAPMFETQLEWLRTTIAWIGGRKDLFLVIRVHPRELPNRRERVISEHAAGLRRLFQDLPANVGINWPDQNLSLYDLVEEADVFLNSWSSAGKEMTMLGRPVVTYGDSLIFYPAELNYTATSVAGYWEQIERALADGWDSDRIRMTYRWLAIEYKLSLIDIAESFGGNDSSARTPVLRRAVNSLGRRLGLSLEQNRDCRRRAERLRASEDLVACIEQGLPTVLSVLQPVPGVSEAEELDAIKVELGRLLPLMYRDLSPGRPGTLKEHLKRFIGNVPPAT